MNANSPYWVPVEERRALAEREVTLNGERATISGINNDYATITIMPHGFSANFAWIFVKRVIERHGGRFNA